MSASVFRRLHGCSVLPGLAGFAWCALNHVCRDGHMEHPPYQWWHYAIDSGWVAAFAVAVVCGFACRPPYLAVPMLLAILASSRLATGSGAGFFLMLELPLALATAVLWLGAVLGPARQRHAEPSAAPDRRGM
jgi:hypothetical protein